MIDLCAKQLESSNAADEYYAIKTESLNFGYNKNKRILSNFSLKIKQGETFALLGSNGCGKTTAIKIILGLMKANSGSIEVYGSEPGSNKNDIPGPGVGYMPQELALFPELTVDQNIKYFAKLNKMTTSSFQKSYNHLIDLFDLSPNRRVYELSGGQKQLVSLTIAFIHRPKLLILDEPTVGVDPIKVNIIWQFLKEFCQQKNHTILITTHYIEEAKNATVVGFMKSGSLMKQGHPQYLMNLYQKETLEEVYLHMWLDLDHSTSTKNLKSEPITSSTKRSKKLFTFEKLPNFQRVFQVFAILHSRVSRIPTLMLGLFLIPMVSLLTLYLALGLHPSPISLSVYTPESDSSLSKQFIDSFDKSLSDIKFYSSKESAIESVVRGKSYIAIAFSDNFTESIETRILYPMEITDEIEHSSTIKLFMDTSRHNTISRAYRYLGKSLYQLIRNLSESIDTNPSAYSLPFTIKETIYGVDPLIGVNRASFDLFMGSVIPDTIQFMIMSISANALFLMRENSLINRYLASGGLFVEILIAVNFYVIFLIMIDIFIILFCAWLFFDVNQLGKWTDVYIMFCMHSLQGMAIGVFVSLVARNKIKTILIMMMILEPQYFMSGDFWPTESTPAYFQKFTACLPITKPMEAIRSIMLKGSSFSHPVVFEGLLVCLTYSIIFSLLTFVFSKRFQ